MTLLNYLISLLIIVLSVLKSADLFIVSDKKLNKLQGQFVKRTKQLHGNQKGNISLVAGSFTTIIAAFMLFMCQKMKLDYREAQYRSQSYLCFHYLNTQSEKYIKKISFFNWALKTAFIYQSTGTGAASGLEISKNLILARNIFHFNYIKNLTTNKYCQLTETISYLENIPYQTNAHRDLVTNFDGTTIIRNRKWTYRYLKNYHNIRKKFAFCLLSDFSINGNFFPNLNVSTREVGLTDLVNSKCLPGFQF